MSQNKKQKQESTSNEILVQENLVSPEQEKLENTALKEIYQEQGGTKEDFTKLEKAPGVWHVITVWVIALLVVSVGSWFVWVYVIKNSQVNFNSVKLLPDGKFESGVSVALEGNAQVASGEETRFTVVYTNNENVLVRDLELVLRYSDQFIFLRSAPDQPVNSYNTIWKVGSLEPGETKKLEIIGQVIGSVGEKKELQATLSYTPLNFHSRFSKKAQFETEIKNSVIVMTVDAPSSFIDGQEVSYIVKYINTSSADMQGIVVRLVPPQGLGIISKTPEPSRENDWEQGVLTPSQEGVITIKGTVAGKRDQALEFVAQVGIVENDQFIIQAQVSHIATFVTPDVDLQLSQTSTSDVLQFGGELAYTVVLTNHSDIVLKDGILRVVIEDEEGIIDSDSFRFPRSTPSMKKAQGSLTLTWTKEELSQLETFNTNDGAAMSFSVNILDVPLDATITEFKVTAQARLEAQSPDIQAPLKYTSELQEAVITAPQPQQGDDRAI
ncbi:MAG: hypothetical protein A3H59_03475 [Candidatus Jacksonbacteria bacterium RIFCSPLOWO2_02_FULL_43_9]|nr:MAG: hypothetical protein UV70_C0001G0037 [Parcubacteria group bacterium GW2011_GWA2_43_13]OGY69239.1 MAG: hypothetical protein A3B94_01760 [Candidatus Jacksonbacteria bacterium RIFCSPHIGHO2_02_FULL_43_10]OGY70392.1 MAG: hypothetical protein A2986_00345 [Candidatus Jacksonbacteria bacterium RIFCSPLOWO2_01_FULL_44_13]OGY73714.1 MAG: hypothetical protein A3H59_03475 [Candidatus Jacksonbacteria bacterium RIFCSPLOWO2_02_FULL_43_9]HAZ16585.1 hypothetical protein [Candidatus Jacksonbacteria bacter